MRLLYTHPFCWPHVRRGTERNMHEVARYMCGRGHDVTTFSTGPNGRVVEETEAGRRVLARSLWHPFMSRLSGARVQATHTFFLNALGGLGALQPEIVHAFSFADATAAVLMKRRRGFKVVFQMNGVGVPGVSCRRYLPPEAPMFRAAIRNADECIVCSDFIGALVREHYGRNAVTLPPPVSLEAWPLGNGPEDGRPTLLGVADFTVRRKGVRALARAFARLKAEVPDALLRLSGRSTPELQREVKQLVSARITQDIEFTGIGQEGDLPLLYQRSSVMVLPSMWEPSGSSMMESLASGTPVVATNHAGLPEFLAPGVGVLFEPLTDAEETQNIEGLAAAMLDGLRLSAQPGVRARCRAHAGRFAMDVLGPSLEALYRRLEVL